MDVDSLITTSPTLVVIDDAAEGWPPTPASTQTVDVAFHTDGANDGLPHGDDGSCGNDDSAASVEPTNRTTDNIVVGVTPPDVDGFMPLVNGRDSGTVAPSDGENGENELPATNITFRQECRSNPELVIGAIFDGVDVASDGGNDVVVRIDTTEGVVDTFGVWDAVEFLHILAAAADNSSTLGLQSRTTRIEGRVPAPAVCDAVFNTVTTPFLSFEEGDDGSDGDSDDGSDGDSDDGSDGDTGVTGRETPADPFRGREVVGWETHHKPDGGVGSALDQSRFRGSDTDGDRGVSR